MTNGQEEKSTVNIFTEKLQQLNITTNKPQKHLKQS